MLQLQVKSGARTTARDIAQHPPIDPAQTSIQHQTFLKNLVMQPQESMPMTSPNGKQMCAQLTDPSSSRPKPKKSGNTQRKRLSNVDNIRINLNYEYLGKEPPFKVGRWAGRKRVPRMGRQEH